ncbi:phage tail protein [Maricaulis sp. D1M11]|uniref:phage tail protein n=1 Tax=Maricaulis sp. D1M11 TaxID=3076117 RepID=UPI0039B4CF5B
MTSRIHLGLLMASTTLLTCAPAWAGPDSYIGQIQMTAATYCARDTFDTVGQTWAISEYPTLYSITSNFYGGNGSSTMGVPDLRGRTGVNYPTGIGLSQIPLGVSGGTTHNYLFGANMPRHSHTVRVSSDSNAQPNPAGQLLATYPGGARYATGTADVEMEYATSTTGNSSPQSFSTVQPTIAIRHCLVTEGPYPARN